MKLREQMETLVDKMLDGKILLGEAVSEFEKLYIQKALARNGEHLSNTAEIIGLHRNTLSKRVSDYKAVTKKRASTKSNGNGNGKTKRRK
jgi:DNA-binding NtrC family response regulator